MTTTVAPQAASRQVRWVWMMFRTLRWLRGPSAALITAKYKQDVLAEYEAADRVGKGQLPRREGLYSSLISAWRDQRDVGALQGLGKPSGASLADPAMKERPGCGGRTTGWRAELDRARQVIEIQSKLSALLDTLAADSSGNNSERLSRTPTTS